MTHSNPSQVRDANLTLHSPVQTDGEHAAPQDGRAPYVAPLVQPLGHWQVHTMDLQSMDILRWT